MSAFCNACLRRPCGFEGHSGLMAQSIGAGRLSFKCEQCGSFWSRVSRGGSVFAWTHITELRARSLAMGIAVPPRSSSWGWVDP